MLEDDGLDLAMDHWCWRYAHYLVSFCAFKETRTLEASADLFKYSL
jgi:hypothetical protein